MENALTLRQRIEHHGLIVIAFGMILIYWIFDSMVTDQALLRILVVALIATYSVLTQHLMNSRKVALTELRRKDEAFAREIAEMRSEIDLLKKGKA